jgi:GTPase
MKKIPTVVIVGRMNVGKSTLFNRLSTSVKSITLDYAGVTRDFIRDEVSWQGRTFELIDTGGISFKKEQDPLLEKVRSVALKKLDDADLTLLVVDGLVGLVQEDREIARHLLQQKKTFVLVVNKDESGEYIQYMHEFSSLGAKKIVSISATHGRGIDTLLDAILAFIPVKMPEQEAEQRTCRVVFLGRPNVGKSSLLNALLQEERSIVSPVAGTTREAVSEKITFYHHDILLTDTPGLRRRRAVGTEIESLMVKSSLDAMKDGDIVVLLIDGTEASIVDQELKLAFYAFEEHHKALILLINKSDLMTEQMEKDLESRLDYYKHIVKKIPVLRISCLDGKNIGRVIPLIHEVWQRYTQRFSDEAIQRLFKARMAQTPLMHTRKILNVYRSYQIRTAPPTIMLEVNEPSWFDPSVLHFFENILREEFDLTGVSVKFIVKKR